MTPFEVLASLPQFVPTDVPGTLLHVQSGCFVSRRTEAAGLLVKGNGGITALDGAAAAKYVKAADMQATVLAKGGQ